MLAVAGAIGLSGISQQNIKPIAAWDQARGCPFGLGAGGRVVDVVGFLEPFGPVQGS